MELYGFYGILFFFQAEDGIRDADVTGVQTCALPIWGHEVPSRDRGPSARHLQEGERAARARADVDLAVGPRRRDDVDHVPFDGGLDVDVLDRGLQGAHLVGRGHALDRRVVRATVPAALEDL